MSFFERDRGCGKATGLEDAVTSGPRVCLGVKVGRHLGLQAFHRQPGSVGKG